MKKGIHPNYFEKAEILCACGNVIKVGSTKEKMEVEICSNCHPFYTGKKKLVDSTGQVDRFQKRMEKAKKIKAVKSEAKKKKVAKIAKKAITKKTASKNK